jgi:hypothetical protein
MKPRDQGQSVQASIGQMIATYRARAGGAASIPSGLYVPGNRVLIVAGVLAAPFVFVGYVGLAMLLVLPLLGLRTMLPRTAPSTGPWYDSTGRDRR